MKSRRRLCAFGAAAALALMLTSAGSASPQAACYVLDAATAYDRRTRLTWQRALDAGSYTWDDAQAYCAGLSVNGSGWRLPSMQELMTIVDLQVSDPAADLEIFPGTPSDYFWSSSARVGSSTSAWGVSFTHGSAGFAPLDFTSRVRCVR